MRKVLAIGVGMTKFGKFPDLSVEQLGRDAVWAAMKDAGFRPKDIQVAYLGNLTESRETGHISCVAQEILRGVGIRGIPTTRVENACASGSTAIREAWLAVGSGLYDIALAVGVEKLTGRGPAPLARTGDTLEGIAGFAPPGMWAMRARRHMAQYGTTVEQMARVAVKNRRHGRLNPRAQYPKEVTVEEVRSSPMICTPLTMLDSCPTTDGGAAAILCSEEVAKRYTTKMIYVAAAALQSGTYESTRNIAVNEIEKRASREAYEWAGIGPEDLDFAEVHDCFTIAEIVRTENLGFCKEGEGGRLVEEGVTALGGKLPVNPSGGLLCKGHPIGATGVAQVAELVWQLREEAGDRQVKGAKVGLAHCSGGFIAQDTGASAVIILKR
ncbi:MAG: thiolase family protein [Deltaproteobacteria bacterium]|nr:thiolase family protein [Deltaproteobacteria bacterium]